MPSFEEALRKRREAHEAAEREKEERKNYTTFDYEPIEWMGFVSNEEVVFRILGKPSEMRSEGTDVRIINWSEILNDAGSKHVNVVWPTNYSDERYKPEEDWFMMDIYKAVNKYTWDNPSKGAVDDKGNPLKGKRVFHYEGTPSFIWVNENKKKNASPKVLPTNFYPARRALINVIDRMDDWCKENKSSKILTNNLSPWETVDEKTQAKTIINFAKYGIPFGVYNAFFDKIIEHRGTWENLDVIVEKRNQEDGGYEIRDSLEDKISPKSKLIAVNGPLTKEELEYKKFDFDTLHAFQVTSYHKIKKEFSNRIKQVDLDTGEHFFERLEELVAVEKEEWDKKRKDSESTQHPVTKPEESREDHEETTSERATRTSREERVQELDVESALKSNFSHWEALDDEDRVEMNKFVRGVVDGQIFYKEGTKLLGCGCEKNHSFPATVYNCVACGKKFS